MATLKRLKVVLAITLAIATESCRADAGCIDIYWPNIEISHFQFIAIEMADITIL